MRQDVLQALRPSWHLNNSIKAPNEKWRRIILRVNVGPANSTEYFIAILPTTFWVIPVNAKMERQTDFHQFDFTQNHNGNRRTTVKIDDDDVVSVTCSEWAEGSSCDIRLSRCSAGVRSKLLTRVSSNSQTCLPQCFSYMHKHIYVQMYIHSRANYRH